MCCHCNFKTTQLLLKLKGDRRLSLQLPTCSTDEQRLTIIAEVRKT